MEREDVVQSFQGAMPGTPEHEILLAASDVKKRLHFCPVCPILTGDENCCRSCGGSIVTIYGKWEMF